jgi:hypothetical protein
MTSVRIRQQTIQTLYLKPVTPLFRLPLCGPAIRMSDAFRPSVFCLLRSSTLHLPSLCPTVSGFVLLASCKVDCPFYHFLTLSATDGLKRAPLISRSRRLHMPLFCGSNSPLCCCGERGHCGVRGNGAPFLTPILCHNTSVPIVLFKNHKWFLEVAQWSARQLRKG